MFYDLLLIPFVVGLVTNKSYDLIFQDANLRDIVQELFEKSVDDFNNKYKGQYGGKYDNFLTRQENLDIIMKKVISLEDTESILFPNTTDFKDNLTPEDVVLDFVAIFNMYLEQDSRLDTYRSIRKNKLLTSRIYDEVSKLREVRYKKFISATEIFEVNDDCISKVKNDISAVLNAILAERIVVINSYRGFGKSFVLSNFALSDEVQSEFSSILVMRHGIRNILDAIQSELQQNETYLVLIDDVDLCTDDLIQMLRFMKQYPEHMKLVISCQTLSVDKMKTILREYGYSIGVKYISINNWVKEDFIELLRATSQLERFIDEELIVVRYPYPKLIGWIGKKNQTGQVSIDKLFNEQKELLESDAFSALQEMMTLNDCKLLLFNLCCIVPFGMLENDITNLREVMNCEYDIRHAIELLIKAGILRKVGNKYRFYPDLRGDIYFAHYLDDDYDTKILDFWIRQNQERILENIGEASLINGFNIDNKLRLLIDEWSKEEDYFSQSRNMKLSTIIVKFAPESILNLVYCYLELSKGKEKTKYFNLSTDDYGPVILELWRYSSDKNAVLELINELEIQKVEGSYSNYKIEGIIQSICSPVKNDAKSIINTLEIIENWIKEERHKAAILFMHAASEILKASHELTRPILNGIEFGQYSAQITDGIREIRKICIRIIKHMVEKQCNFDNIVAIEKISRNIGMMSYSITPIDDAILNELVLEERRCIVEILGKMLIDSKSPAIKIVIEKLFLHWWAGQTPGTEEASIYLNEMDRDGLFLFVKYYVDADYRMVKFSDIELIAPSVDRWKWFVYEVMHNTSDKWNDSQRIAEMLAQKVTTIKELHSFLKVAADEIDKVGLTWSMPRIIDFWIEINSTLFEEYFYSEWYNQTADYIKAKIFERITMMDCSVNLTIINEKLSSGATIDEVFAILKLLENELIEIKDIFEILHQILNDYSKINFGSLIHRLYFIFKGREIKGVSSFLASIIDKEVDRENVIDSLDFFIHHRGDELKKEDVYQELREKIISMLLDVENFKYHENSLLEKVIEDSNYANTFVTRRLKSKRLHSYKKIPYDGFTFLNKYIISWEELDKLINEIMILQDDSDINVVDSHRIVKPLIMKKDCQGFPLIVTLLKHYCQNNNIKEILFLLKNQILNESTIEVYSQVLVYLKDNALSEKAEESIYLHRFPEGGHSRSIGSFSPEKEKLLSLYELLHNLLPHGMLKIATANCIEYIKNDIQEDLISDEEFLNPR